MNAITLTVNGFTESHTTAAVRNPDQTLTVISAAQFLHYLLALACQ